MVGSVGVSFYTRMLDHQLNLIAAIQAFIWDILLNVDNGYRLMFRHKLGLPTFAYFLSRYVAHSIPAVLSNTWSVSKIERTCLRYHQYSLPKYAAQCFCDPIRSHVLQTSAAPLPNCEVVKKTICVLYHVAFSSTSLLFFLRVRAVFKENKYIVICFFCLWLSVLGGSLTIATLGDAVHLGPTRYCRAINVKAYAIAAPITFAVNDTFVFLAISWRLMTNSMPDHKDKISFKSVILGEYLPAFSRALLNDGQIYYLCAPLSHISLERTNMYLYRCRVSVTSNLVVVILTSIPMVPPSYRLMFTVLNIALTNMMACRVFRHTKLRSYNDDTVSSKWMAAQMKRIDLDTTPESSQLNFARAPDAPSGIASSEASDKTISEGPKTPQSTSFGDVEYVDAICEEKPQLARPGEKINDSIV